MKSFLTLFLSLFIFSLIAFAQENKAPDFVLPDIDGNNYRLYDHLGEGPILINFWATWCIPCREEMKKLKKIYKKYKDDQLEILSISIDDPKTVGKVKGFVNTYRYPFTFLLDTNNEVIRLYQGNNPPYTVLLDKDGTIVYTHTGYRKGDEKKVEEKIAHLISLDQK
ncbi:MAG: TlpA family protein disulfide reductase [Calditrichaeota bacterium]|nr:MAG: TlpA family protein disulfide reductase [Calditrichota bacterium]